MALPEAAAPSRVTQQACVTPPNTPPPLVTKSLVTRDFDLTIRAFFPTPTAPTKFNPIRAMSTLLRTILKDEPSLVLRTPSNDMQLVLASDPIPTGEAEFKKYFKVSTTRREKQNQSHVCIGCHLLTNRSLGKIKFQSTNGNLLAWLKKERVFIESDNLGTDRPVTIGHFTNIASTLTHLANFREHLMNKLMLIDIDAETAVDLAPHLKTAQLEAMTNGDDFVPILPDFEVYRTHLSHGREPTKVTTDVLGVKCAPRDAKLLGEFFTRMSSESSTDQKDGVFLPKGAVHLLGPQTYEQVLKANNFFLTTVATVPINLEYGAWFALIDPHSTSDTDPLSLHEHLLRKSWFLRIESVARNKCLIITTKPNLPEARAWVDANLEPMVRKSIPDGIDPPSSQLPRRLDKPVYSALSRTYADVLKKQFSTASPSTTTTDHNRPPRKRQAALIDYDSDQSAETPSFTQAVANSNENHHHSKKTTATTTNNNYATELLSIKTEINELKKLITEAVGQFKAAIESFTATPRLPISNDMDTDVEERMAPTANNQNTKETTPEISELITELKNDIATIAVEMREKFKDLRVLPQLPPFELTPFPTFPT